MNDALTESLNHPAGRLAEILLKRLVSNTGGPELAEPLRLRLDALVQATGKFGRLARVRLASEVALLFERAPAWTEQNIVPLFNWSSRDAADAWSARRYANYIGSPKLFGLTKGPFLELLRKPDLSEDDLRTYAGWLAAIEIANQSGKTAYPITAIEARSALRQAGAKSLPNVAHRLAVEMASAKPDAKVETWNTVVGPAFQAIWPIDIDLQTPAATFSLVHILRGAGAAFPQAAKVIIPFIRSEDPRNHTSVYSLSQAEDILFSTSPESVLDLAAALVGEASAGSVYGLDAILKRVRHYAPEFANSKKFQKLISLSQTY